MSSASFSKGRPGAPSAGSAADRRNDTAALGDSFLSKASRLAFSAGGVLAKSRRWVEDGPMADHPVATLGCAFGLGVLTGWLIKR